MPQYGGAEACTCVWVGGHFRLAGGGDKGLQKLFGQEVQGALKYKGTAHYAWV